MKFIRKNNQDNSNEKGLVPLRDMMNRVFNESFLFPNFSGSFFSDPFFSDTFFGPELSRPLSKVRVDIEEKEDKFLIKAELPGVDPEKIDLDLTPERLTITAEISEEKEAKDKNYLKRECSFGKLQRSFNFSHAPINMDSSEADCKNGLLKITLPKQVQTPKAGKKIPINS